MPRPNRAMMEPTCPRDDHRVERGVSRFKTKPHDAANLKQHDQNLEDGANIRRETDDHTGSFLGSCVGHAKWLKSECYRELLLRARWEQSLDLIREHIADQLPKNIQKCRKFGTSRGKLEKKTAPAQNFLGPGWKTYTTGGSILHAATHMQ